MNKRDNLDFNYTDSKNFQIWKYKITFKKAVNIMR